MLLGIGTNSESHKISDLRARLSAYVNHNSTFDTCLTYNYEYRDFRTPESLIEYIYITFQELSLSNDSNFWTNFWAELERRMPYLGKLKVRHHEINKRKYSHSLGTSEAGERLDRLFGQVGFHPGIWRVRNSENIKMEETMVNKSKESKVGIPNGTVPVSVIIPPGTTGPITIYLNLTLSTEQPVTDSRLENGFKDYTGPYLVRKEETVK
jgi:hypothetical protein